MAKKKINDMNGKNQAIAQKFVEREVFSCVSYLVGDCIEKGVINYEDIENNTEDTDGNYPEIFEYWLVSSYLFDKLKEKGEPVIETHALKIWGRCTTGQGISIDRVIEDICSDMEILHGQKYAWKV